eukprot:4155540-Amphidinium_carterae.1
MRGVAHPEDAPPEEQPLWGGLLGQLRFACSHRLLGVASDDSSHSRSRSVASMQNPTEVLPHQHNRAIFH